MAPRAPSRARAHQPCAACKMLRRRCDGDCILAPYFPGHDVQKFAGVHKVFGASNVIKMIQVKYFFLEFLCHSINDRILKDMMNLVFVSDGGGIKEGGCSESHNL